MKNRTRLVSTNEYDLLTKINKGLYRDYFCVLELIEERKIYSKEDKNKRCYVENRSIKTCEECIQNWLNREEGYSCSSK